MYSDLVVAETKISKTLKNRLNGGSGDFSSRGKQQQVTRKRGRQDDDKWEHDLFEDDDEPRLSKRRVDPKDLRLKLQKKRHGSQIGGRVFSVSVADLRDKLSRTVNPQTKNSKREAVRPAIKKVSVGTKPETRAAPNRATKKDPQQNNDASVDSFLESLGLEKYSTAFQVEEVDMDALRHMTDDDLKALLIPMGPRKKILLALGDNRG